MEISFARLRVEFRLGEIRPRLRQAGQNPPKSQAGWVKSAQGLGRLGLNNIRCSGRQGTIQPRLRKAGQILPMAQTGWANFAQGSGRLGEFLPRLRQVGLE